MTHIEGIEAELGDGCVCRICVKETPGTKTSFESTELEK